MDRVITLALVWITGTTVYASEEYYYQPFNVTRTTPSGIAAYRSALTLDWLAAEDTRQRELVAAFETEPVPPSKFLATDCISYPRPAAGKVARLILELLKNLEGDEGVLVSELIHTLIRTKLLGLETSAFDSEPDLDALVKTPGVMMGEPHVTFPRILAMIWMTVTDASTLKLHGWCTINKINKYLTAAKPSDVAKNLRALEPIVARARFIMEEFILHVTPLNMMAKTTTTERQEHVIMKNEPIGNVPFCSRIVPMSPPPLVNTRIRNAKQKIADLHSFSHYPKPHLEKFISGPNPKNKRPVRKHNVVDELSKGTLIFNETQPESSTYFPLRFLASEGDIFLSSSSLTVVPQMCKIFLAVVFLLFCD